VQLIFSIRSIPSSIFRLLALVAVAALCISPLPAQQTLGGITGEVTDSSGSVIPNAEVTITSEQTGLTRIVKSNGAGEYQFVNLPIGSYTLTYTAEGFEVQSTPHITVQADRTATVNAKLKVGSKADTIEVDATPLMNAVDTTNGYVLENAQIEAAPLPTGSFTGLAILSTGVSAELPGGSGVTSGLGNAPIWANGQRDTSNTFQLNGVDASNLFNGKSTSQVASARIVNNTGVGNSSGGGAENSSASVYLSIGNAIPSPTPEMLEEVRVNASMYDAQQGSTSGAHIDMSTKAGTNALHGNAYIHRATDWLNAAPFFFNQDEDIPANMKVPQLHRYSAGGTLGGAIIKDKLFGFIGYQHLHVSDQEVGYSRFAVPVGLGAGANDRSADDIATVTNAGWCPYPDPTQSDYYCPMGSQISGSTITNSPGGPVALAMLQAPAVAGEPGNWLVPAPTSNALSFYHPYNVSLPGTAYFTADQLVGDVDYNAGPKDTLALKYYYQHDPAKNPYAYSNVPGFTQHMDTGSQVFSINNVNLLRPNLSVTETMGFIREKIYSTNDQPYGPSEWGINSFGSSYLSGVSIVDSLGYNLPSGASEQSLNIGPGSSQGSLTGVFQNRWMPSANAIWTLGKHTVAIGGNWAHTQLNPRDKRPGVAGTTASADFGQFVQGLVTINDDFQTTTFLQGNGDRYYRTNQTGLFVQDKFQVTPHLSLTFGLRYDWNGAFTEKNGRLFNFNPSLFDAGSADDPTNPDGTITNNGYVIAKDNHDTTLTGRQYAFSPRIGVAWTPSQFNNKVVVRAGSGFYYDRGELFSYFSPGYAAGEVLGGPFGVSQAPPFVNSQNCGAEAYSYNNLYKGYIPTCTATDANLSMPWGATLGTAPTGKASDISLYLPNAYNILNNYAQPFSMGVYDQKNTLPYSINYTLDVQWQPRSDIAIEVGYVGNLGRHQVIPLPFNQAQIASPSSPIRGQNYTYGYTVASDYTPINLPDGTTYLDTFEGGNSDLRVPYIGYSDESEDYRTVGISAYNALQVHVDKRLSHGFQAGASYTYSHATDEQSGMGLFYNGNNANNVRSGYGLADFDRKHVLNFTYSYTIPKLYAEDTLKGKITDGWSLNGITVLQSGQPFSIVDYTGAVGSIYYSVFDGITNPIVPLAAGCNAKNARNGSSSGAFTPINSTDTYLKANCFTVPLLAPGALNGAIPSNDPFETTFVSSGQRNIFRQAAQRRADISLAKVTKFGERSTLRYTFDVFNLTNTTSFDVTGDDVSQNEYYNNFPDISLSSSPLPTGCTTTGSQTNTSFYNCPTGLGVTQHTIGSPRQIQMSLHYDF
jgi:hypothetical protein